MSRAVGAWVLAVVVAPMAPACGGQSSIDSSSGGAVATGGAGGTGAGVGGAAIGGAAGSPAAGSGASAGAAGRPVNTDPECVEIRTNTPCMLEGKSCPDLVCGPNDVGRRNCVCATTWSCTACDGVRPMTRDPNIQSCPSDVAPGGPCVTESSVCGPLGEEYCACYDDPEAGLVWDCDTPPDPWGP